MTLPPPLDEFRTALEAEVEAASREAASGAVSLLNGKRIGQVGSAFQYVFHIETPLNLPADSPGDLHVEGRAPVAATVVSTEGLVVTLSVGQDLGPHIPQARLRSDLVFLLRRLIERLESYAAKPNPAGDRILGSAAPRGRPEPLTIAELNAHQSVAVGSALGRDTTFIWGPPGTGKTATIGHIGVELYERDRSLLLVSHTNIAVDQALLRIAERLAPEDLEDGRVLRVGEPQDRQLAERPELLLSEHARRRQEKLAGRQVALQREREDLREQVLADQRRLELVQWVRHAATDLAEHGLKLQLIADLEVELEAADSGLTEAAARKGQLMGHKQAARRLLGRIEQLAVEASDLRERGRQEHRRRTEDMERLEAEARKAEWQVAVERAELAKAQAILEEAREHGALLRRWKGLPKPDEQEQIVDALSQRLEAARTTAMHAAQRRQDEEQQLAALDAQLTALSTVGDTAEWDAQEALPTMPSPPPGPLENLAQFSMGLAEAGQELPLFREQARLTPRELLRALEAATDTEKERRRARSAISSERDHAGNTLRATLRNQFQALLEFGLLREPVPAELPDQVELLTRTHAQAHDEVGDVDVTVLRGSIDSANARISRIDGELDEIQEALSRVEENLVAEATIVATTLTRAYLRDPIQDRDFDTVVLDEASMAPIPALWVAAGVAARGVVVVGDPDQLPPIKHSRLPLAEKWLGRDIFEVSGVVEQADGKEDGHLVKLLTQYRMHPAISAIPNELVYRRELVDGPNTDDDGELDGFYDRQWGPDEPVLVLDTGPLNAWVTTVDRGTKTSRLNFLSATICADLAEQLLRDDRPPHEVGQSPRILIVAPYRPHANLLALLIREQGLEDEVAVGTAHSFQGNEAPIVIFDLVVDEPHWRVGLFVADYDSSNYRLLNVALTRARSRLFIVGDIDYAATKGKNAFLGRLMRFIERYRRVPAHDVLPVGLSARAAAAHLQATGGPLEADADRLIVDAPLFYRYLASDLAAARKRVVIYSPYVTPERVSQLDPHLRAATERGVALYLVTKPLQERPRAHQQTSRQVEEHLGDIGAVVLHKRAMHEKVVLIDDDTCWVGSLNTLSFTGTGEVMERRRSPAVTSDYIKHLRLEELIGAIDTGEDRCPVCEEELAAAEGNTGPYWRCENGCFTRSLDQPHPTDGRLRCGTCGGDFEYGQWGGRPHWRCTENPRHRQRVGKQHLRLPAMRDLVPAVELRALRREWQMDD